tara:strand:+ start:25422 stop:26291 length:870 start_codon:yes stop_codon:yes gene_type:complete
VKITLQPKGPFDFYKGLNDLTRQPFNLTEHLTRKNYQTILFGNIISIAQDNSNGNLIIQTDANSDKQHLQISQEISQRFGLNQKITSFYKFISGNEYLKPMIQKLNGLRMYQKSTPFEALVTAITDQQLNVAFAIKLKQRFIKNFGIKHQVNGEIFYSFPTPEQIALLKDDALKQFQYSGMKSKYIIQLAKGIVKGDYPLENWMTLKNDELIERLTGIYGVGRWTAEYTAMIGFNRCDIVPAADIGLQRAVQKCYGLSKRPTEDDVRKIAESWQPWRGLTTYYLWHAYE